MKHLYLLFFIFIIFSYSIVAQQTTFQAAYSFSGSIPIFTDIIQNSSGQYLMTGTSGTTPIIAGTVTEIDSAAQVVWSKKYISGSIETEIVDVKNVNGGGYITAGASDTGLLLMRLDNSGNVIWSNTYHVSSGTSENASRVLPTSDGGFVVAGYVYSATPQGYARQDSANCYILKVNSSGTLLWAKVVFCSIVYINDHLLNDVAEATDGYVFVGSMSQAHDDNAGTYGLVMKTDFNGNIRYIKHWGAPGDDAEATSISTLTGTTQLVGGYDNAYAILSSFNSNTGTASGYKYGNGFQPIYSSFNAVPTFDGNYAMIGMAVPGSQSYVLKINPSTGAVMWGEEYNGGFDLFNTEGRQVSDSGFVIVSTAENDIGYVSFLVKTNSRGTTSREGCTSTSFSPGKATFNDTLTSFTPDTLQGSTGTTFTPTVLDIQPTDSIYCIVVDCTAPSAPSTSSASPATICSGSPATITDSGSMDSVTYNVYDAATNGNFLGAAPLTVNPIVTTTYYVEASTGSGCVSNSRQAVTVTVTGGLGTVGTITGSATPCVGGQAYSIAPVTNATSYTWSVSGGGTITGGQGTTNITVTWAATGNYTITAGAVNLCGSATNTLAVTVGGVPGAATASALPNPACAGQNVALSVTSTGSTTWEWSGPNAYSSTLQAPSINAIHANQAGTYTIIASNICGSATASVNVAVNSKPANASATANTNPACQSQTVTLTGAATSATSWSWSGSNLYTSTLQSPQLTNVQANQSGVYTLIAVNTCGNDTATVNLAVNAVPAAVLATAMPNNVCAGSGLTLSGSATGASSYSWSGPNGFSTNVLTTSLLNFQIVSTGVYTLSARNTCGTATTTVTVNLATAPIAVSAGANPTSTCSGSNILFTGTSTGATSYTWTGPNGFTSNRQNPGITNSNVAYSGAYIFTAANTCGSTSATVVVNVDTLIQDFFAISGSGDTLCTGFQLTLLGGGMNVNNWQWTGPNGFESSQQDTTVNSAAPVNSGQYILIGTNACGSLSDSINIYIENGNGLSLTASSSATHDSACYGATINLFATDSFDTYLWTGPNYFSSQQNPVLTNATVAQSGVYVVSATSHCGQLTDSVHVYIDTIPQGLQLSTSGTNNASCQGQSITLTAVSPGVTNWSWTGPAGFTSTQSSFSISSIQLIQQGNYIVTATNTCGSKTDTVPVTVFTQPNITSGPTVNFDSICPAGTANFSITATGGTPSLTYQWQYMDGSSWAGVSHNIPTGANYVNQTTDSLRFSGISIPGTYQYRCVISATGSGCNSVTSHEVIITVVNQPTTTNLTGDTICQGGVAGLSLTAANGIFPLTYQWQYYNGADWADVSPNSPIGAWDYADSNSNSLTITTNNSLVSGTYQYRCLVNSPEGSGCAQATSQTASLNVGPKPYFILQPSPDSIAFCAFGGTTSINVQASAGNLVPVYEWQSMGPGGSEFSPVPDGIFDSIIINNLSQGLYYYRCLVNANASGCAGPSSNTVVVNVIQNPTINSISPTSLICAGGNTVIEVTAIGGTPSLTYQWQYANGGAWANVSSNIPNGVTEYGGNLSDSLVITTNNSITSGQYWYRCMVSASGSGCIADTSVSVSAIVNPNPIVTLTIGNADICVGDTLHITRPATGPPSDIYTLYSSTNGGVTWQANPDSNTLISIPFLSTGQVEYKMAVSSTLSGCIPDTSATLLVNVYSTPGTPAVTFNSSAICNGSANIPFYIVNPGSNYSYEWYIIPQENIIVDNNQGSVAEISFTSPVQHTLKVKCNINGLSCYSDTMLPINVNTMQAPGNLDIVLTEPGNNLLCLNDTLAGYTWGYDSKGSYESFVLGSGSSSLYSFSASFDTLDNAYWAYACSSDGCCTRQYYNSPEKYTAIAVGNENDLVEIYPNPTSGTLVFSNNSNAFKNCAIYSVQGQFLKNLGGSPSSSEVILNISDLAAGSYLLAISNKETDNSLVLKMIVLIK